MTDKYILNADHTLRPTDDLEEWAQAFGVTERRVARTEVAPGVVVSTVFLGIDHSFGHGLPLVFETMIFGGKHDEDQWRYSAWEEAEAGHQRAVEAAASVDTHAERQDAGERLGPKDG